MTFQPNTAGTAERDLIDSMLKRQDQVLSDLDELSARIDAAITDLTEQRKRDAAEQEIDSSPAGILPFGLPSDEVAPDSQAERAA